MQGKNYARFTEIPLGRIRPEGWLRDFLLKQKEGLTGRIEVAGYPFDRVGWDRFDVDTTRSNENPGWWAYEQTAYHLDGLTRLAELLNDRELRKKAAASFEYVLRNADPDGYLGPKLLKNSDGWNRWPHVVFFRALAAKYAATGDRSILRAVEKHYLGPAQKHDRARDVLNVEILLWAYLQGGNERLLEMAKRDFASYNASCRDDNCAAAQLSRRKAYAHGVTYNEYSKLGAMLYTCTGDKRYLAPSVRAYKKIDRYQMLPDGLHCSNEFLLDNDYMQSHETCDISDYTWALGYLLMSTGKAEYADKIEKCIFNAGFGAVEENFRALQYLSGPNQLALTRTSNHADFLKGDKWMSYRPNPGTECCAGNVNRFFPNYCARMWMQKGRNGFAAVLYGASRVRLGKTARAGTIVESTDYPFSDTICFRFDLPREKTLHFYLRLPGYCKDAQIFRNGVPADYTVKDGFAHLHGVFRPGDVVQLRLPMQVREEPCGKDGVCFSCGPLLFAYGMHGNRKIDPLEKNQSADFPAYDITPDRPFNYAVTPGQNPQLRTRRPGANPWSIEGTPLYLRVRAKRVPGWELKRSVVIHPVYNLYTRPWKRETKVGNFLFTPRLPGKDLLKKAAREPEEEILLVPYGAAKARLSVFPKVEN